MVFAMVKQRVQIEAMVKCSVLALVVFFAGLVAGNIMPIQVFDEFAAPSYFFPDTLVKDGESNKYYDYGYFRVVGRADYSINSGYFSSLPSMSGLCFLLEKDGVFYWHMGSLGILFYEAHTGGWVGVVEKLPDISHEEAVDMFLTKVRRKYEEALSFRKQGI